MNKWDDLTKQQKITRSVASVGIVAMVTVFYGAASQIPDPPAKDRPVAENTAQGTPAKIAAVSSPSTPTVEHKQLYLSAYGKVLDAAKLCDTANTKVSSTLTAAGTGKASIFDAYSDANDASNVCSDTALALADIEAPGVGPDNAQKSFQDGIDKCRTAYGARNRALDTLKTALDGDMRPSVVNEFKEQTEYASSGIILCVANLMSAAMEAGAKEPEMNAFFDSRK